MQSWLGHKLISYGMRRSRAGAIRPPLLLGHPAGRFPFRGENSGSGVYRGREEVAAWLGRLVAAGVQTFPDEVVVTGPPWRATVCVRGHDHVDAPDGRRVYENRFVIWGRLAGGGV